MRKKPGVFFFSRFVPFLCEPTARARRGAGEEAKMRTSSTLPCTMVTTPSNPLSLTIWRACSAIEEHSMPTTRAAPAFAANRQRIPVPHPTSSTVLPLKRWRLLRMAFM